MDRLAELQIFVEVVERGDYSAAARTLDLTPSAVSKSVKRLETRLGARLLDRTSRNMRVTSEGETLYFSAREAIASVEKAEASVVGSLSCMQGCIVIHAPPSFAVSQISKVLPEFLRQHPGIRLSFILSNKPILTGERRVDLTIVVGRPTDSDFIARKIATTRWVICASPEYLEARGHPRTLDDLRHHTCVGYVLGASGSTPKPITPGSSAPMLEATSVAANSAYMLQALALGGAGVAQLAYYQVAADLAAGRLVRLLPDVGGEPEDIYAIYPRELRGSARIRSLLNYFCDKFRGLEAEATSGGRLHEVGAVRRIA